MTSLLNDCKEQAPEAIKMLRTLTEKRLHQRAYTRVLQRRPGDAALAADEVCALEGQDHLVDRGRADAEVLLHLA